MTATLLVVTLSIVVPSTPIDPRRWPDDAVIALLEAAGEIIRYAPAPYETAAPRFLVPAAEEAARRRLTRAAPVLRDVYLRLPHATRHVIGGIDASEAVGNAFGKLEAASREWERIEATYVPLLERSCDRVVPPTREEMLGPIVSAAMVFESGGLDHLREWAAHPSRCVRRRAAAVLGIYLAHPGDADRAVLRHLLGEPDAETQLHALRGLLRGVAPEQQRKVATEYLASDSRTGELGAALAQRVNDGSFQSLELLTPAETAEEARRMVGESRP